MNIAEAIEIIEAYENKHDIICVEVFPVSQEQDTQDDTLSGALINMAKTIRNKERGMQ